MRCTHHFARRGFGFGKQRVGEHPKRRTHGRLEPFTHPNLVGDATNDTAWPLRKQRSRSISLVE